MKGYITDELKMVKSVLEDGEFKCNEHTLVGLLIRYYYLKGDITNVVDMKQKIKNFIIKNKEIYKDIPKSIKYSEQKITKLFKPLDSDADKYKDYKVRELHISNSINITEYELEVIDTLKDVKLKKIAYIMLIYAKLINQRIENEDNKNWISIDVSNIFSEAKVSTRTKDEKLKMLNEIKELGLIEVTPYTKSFSLKVRYVYEKSNAVFTVDDFEDVIYTYLIYLGEKWKKCDVCGRWVTWKGLKPRKYCFKCAKKVNIINTMQNRQKV